MTKPKLREIRIVGDLAYVPLTQGKEAVIDAADVHIVEGWLWHAHKGKRTFYAARQNHLGKGRVVRILMHTAITGLPFVDHRDGNGTNNTRQNLRQATVGENCRNSRLRKDSMTGRKGVQHVGGARPFRARIRANGVTMILGRFETLDAAAAAYAQASAIYHGEFGRVA